MKRLLLILLISGCATTQGERNGCADGDLEGFDDASEDLTHCYPWDPDEGFGMRGFGMMTRSDGYKDAYELEFEACYTEAYLEVYPEDLSGAACVPLDE